MRTCLKRNAFPVSIWLSVFTVAAMGTACHRSTNANPVVIKHTSNLDPRDELIPDNVRKYLLANFPEYSMPQKNDYPDSWWSFYDSESIPYAITTDINDDQLADYALILKKSDSVDLLILTGAGDSFKSWLMRLPPGNPTRDPVIGHGLTNEPPGQIDIAYPEIRSLSLKSNGVNLMEFENRIAVCYWADGAVRLFLTGDQKLNIDAN